VTGLGGQGIAVQYDHRDDAQAVARQRRYLMDCSRQE